jgi:hypothetical protein
MIALLEPDDLWSHFPDVDSTVFNPRTANDQCEKKYLRCTHTAVRILI